MVVSLQNRFSADRSNDSLDDAEKGQYDNKTEFTLPLPFAYMGQQSKIYLTSQIATPISFYDSTTPFSSVPELLLSWPAGSQATNTNRFEKTIKKSALSKKKPSRWVLFNLWFNTYRKFFTLIILLNLAGIIMAALGRFTYAENHMGALVLGNLLCAILMRNELWMRFLYNIAIYGLRSVGSIPIGYYVSANEGFISGLRCTWSLQLRLLYSM